MDRRPRRRRTSPLTCVSHPSPTMGTVPALSPWSPPVPLDMRHEPIRLPALLWAALVVVLAIAITVIVGLPLQEAITTVLAVVAIVGGPVAMAESRRARTDSPATIQAQLDEIDRHLRAQVDAGHDEDPPA